MKYNTNEFQTGGYISHYNYECWQKCVLEQGRQLVDSQHWGSVMEYVFLAWTYVRATPLWDNPPHNAARRQCFKSLTAQCMTALKKGTWNPEQCDSFQER